MKIERTKNNFINLEKEEDIRKLSRKLNIEIEKIKELIELKEQLYEKILNQRKLKIYQELSNFINNVLRKKYSQENLLKYLSFHIFIGSTFKLSDIEYLDLPEEDSIVNKVRKLIQ